MSYFAAALSRSAGAWSGQELDLSDVADMEELTDVLRDFEGGPVLLLLEQDDEWLGVVRVDGDDDPRVFLSDRRAVEVSDVAALIWEVEPEPPVDSDDEEGPRPVAEPVGDPGLLADLGTSADDLLGLCAHEGFLPGDVLTAVGERAGFLDVLDDLREV